MDTGTLWVLGNRRAGRGRAGRLAPRLEELFRRRGIASRFLWPDSEGALRNLAATAAGNDCRRLVVVGGDGTLLQAINGASGSGIEFGLIPAGDANDVAAALGLPRDPLAAAERLFEWTARPVDLLKARLNNGEEYLYAGAGGAGLDAEAARLAGTRFRRLPHIWRYLAGALAALRRFSPFELEARLDTQAYRGRAFLAVVANAPAYGGGIRVAPAARMDDGRLDTAIIEELDWPRILRSLPSILHSGDIRDLSPLLYSSRKVRLETATPVAFHADGEPLGFTPVEVEVLPAALRIVCLAQPAPRPGMR